MAISQMDVCEVTRVALEEIEDIVAAYAPTQRTPGEGGLPTALQSNDMPCALVMPGRTLGYILNPGRNRHDWQLRVLLLVGGADFSENAFIIGPMPDQVVTEVAQHLTANGYANLLLYTEGSGLSVIEWAGYEYMGYELIFKVSEAAAVTVATGE